MSVLSSTQYSMRTETPVTMFWNWVTGKYYQKREDTVRTYEWETDGANANPAAIDPDNLIAAGWRLEWRGNTPARDNKTGVYSEIYAQRGDRVPL